jgi:hypothetical protein
VLKWIHETKRGYSRCSSAHTRPSKHMRSSARGAQVNT